MIMRAFSMMLLVTALTVALVLPASAQMMGQMQQGGQQGGQMGGMGGMMGQGGMMGGMGGMGGGMMGGMMGQGGMREGREGRMMSHEGPLITIMLEHSQDLGLNPEQEKKLRDLRTEFSKESVRRTADIRVAQIELNALLEQDQWDVAKIEPKVKQLATLQGDLRLARIKTLAAGRAVLTPQQVEKLKQVGHQMRGMMMRQGGMGPGMMGPGMMGPGMTGPGMTGPGMTGPGMTGPGQSPGPGMQGHEGHGAPPAPRQ
jgi:Spy/CpxP family protein refolding chaperone